MPEYRASYRSTDPTKQVVGGGALTATEFHAACAEARSIAEKHPAVRLVTVSDEDGACGSFPVNVRLSHEDRTS